MSTQPEPTIGKIVADISRDLSNLVQSEIQLAKAELRVSVKSGGIGAALLAVAAFLAVLFVIMLSFAAAYFITMTGLHAAWSFLIVAGFYLLIALLFILFGIRSLKRIRAPEKTIDTTKQIPGAFKGGQPNIVDDDVIEQVKQGNPGSRAEDNTGGAHRA